MHSIRTILFLNMLFGGVLQLSAQLPAYVLLAREPTYSEALFSYLHDTIIKQNRSMTLEDIGTYISEDSILYYEYMEMNASANRNYHPSHFQRMNVPKMRSLYFCGGVEGDSPVGVSSIFYNNLGSDEVFIYLTNKQAFEIKDLTIEFYVHDENGNKYARLYKSQRYSIKPNWEYTYIRHKFEISGEYLLRVYGPGREMLGEGYITILTN